MSFLLWMTLGLLAGTAVYTAHVTYITKQSALKAAKNVMSSDEIRKTMRAIVTEATGTSIKLDMLDSMGSSVCEVKVTGEEIARDIVRGDILC